MNLIELAKDNKTITEAYIATDRVSRAYLQRKYMISFTTADELAMELEKHLKSKQGKPCLKVI